MLHLQFVPWQKIAYWRCNSCGNCCKDYSVVLNFSEWLTLVQTFGPQTTFTGADKFFIKRLGDGSCTFLCNFKGNQLCSLQQMKPNACKIWPFKVLSEPKYGEPNQAVFTFGGKKLFIYADANCCGLRYGNPTWEFSSVTLKEFAKLAMGLQREQYSSTRRVSEYGIRHF